MLTDGGGLEEKMNKYEIPLADDGLPDWNKILDYNEATGKLFWKIKVNSKNKIGGSVESFDKINGYYRFRLGSKFYKCHRVIWYIMTGEGWAKIVLLTT